MHINGEIFLSLICVLLDKLKCGWEDYEYEDLLKPFWKELSSQYSSFVEKHGILNKIVKYVLNGPVPFNVRDSQAFISNEYEKEINEADGVRLYDLLLLNLVQFKRKFKT
ncbi:hypothetical protein NPIL_288801 [Nephila pilipes]|uniref:Uncharacterized protein n=1 Tax=Nephila pilipes TaxID=299642 RepID=A0A8X6QRE1_NEPPI|nr:hypothetical protein NPIL_288801 [Nephila pilipes]